MAFNVATDIATLDTLRDDAESPVANTSRSPYTEHSLQIAMPKSAPALNFFHEFLLKMNSSEDSPQVVRDKVD